MFGPTHGKLEGRKKTMYQSPISSIKMNNYNTVLRFFLLLFNGLLNSVLKLGKSHKNKKNKTFNKYLKFKQ